MKTLWILLFLWSKAWSFQVLQTTNEATVTGTAEVPQEIVVGDGDLKIKIIDANYDIQPETHIQFVDDQPVLLKGAFHWRTEQAQTTKIKTPVATITLTGTDFVVHYEPDVATATVEALGGNALVQGDYRIEVLNVQVGERGKFVGVAESDGPAFDVLLRNRKAVRGNLQGPEKMTNEQLKALDSTYTLKLRPVVKKEKPKPKPGQICANPFAKYNECVLRCQNNPPGQKNCRVESSKVICLREKCLASGQWGDATALQGAAKKACGASTSTVTICDY